MVALHGRYADLLVLGQEDPAAESGHPVVETALFGAGRPVLVSSRLRLLATYTHDPKRGTR